MGAANLHSSSNKSAAARRLTAKNIERIGDAHKSVYDEDQKAQRSVERLANRKYGVIQTSIKNFIQSYERLMQIEFKESDGIKELSDPNLIRKNLDSMKSNLDGVLASVKETDSKGVGFLSAMLSGGGILCAGGMIAARVGLPLTFGSVAAALNPILIPATFAVALTKSFSDDSANELRAAQIQKKYANVVVAQAESNVEVLRAVHERADRLTDLLTKLNVLFIKSLQVVNPIIDKNGKDRTAYTAQDKELIRNCLNLADAVKSVLDTPLFENDGTIAEVSACVLKTGEDYLQRMQQIMTA